MEESPEEDDRLPETALVGVDLPAATLKALATTGVPRELKLPEWPGPVLFHSELGSGKLVASSAEDALVRRGGPNEGYIIGSVRDAGAGVVTDPESGTGTTGVRGKALRGESGRIYSVFCLRKGVGDVVLLDVSKPEDDRFVNASLDAFLTSMHAFVTAWPHFATDGSARGDAVVASFRTLLNKVDPRALANDEHYWPGWLEELE